MNWREGKNPVGNVTSSCLCVLTRRCYAVLYIYIYICFAMVSRSVVAGTAVIFIRSIHCVLRTHPIVYIIRSRCVAAAAVRCTAHGICASSDLCDKSFRRSTHTSIIHIIHDAVLVVMHTMYQTSCDILWSPYRSRDSRASNELCRSVTDPPTPGPPLCEVAEIGMMIMMMMGDGDDGGAGGAGGDGGGDDDGGHGGGVRWRDGDGHDDADDDDADLLLPLLVLVLLRCCLYDDHDRWCGR